MLLLSNIRTLLLTLAVAGVCITEVSTRADAQGTKPFKGQEITVSRTDGLAPGTWQDPFLVQARLTAPGFYFEDSEFISEGRDNYNGPYTAVNRQMLYIISAAPLQALAYIWTEKTYSNGRKAWSSEIALVDSEGAEGTWLSYLGEDPSSGIGGSGTFTSVLRSDIGARIYESEIIGRVLTVGASKK